MDNSTPTRVLRSRGHKSVSNQSRTPALHNASKSPKTTVIKISCQTASPCSQARWNDRYTDDVDMYCDLRSGTPEYSCMSLSPTSTTSRRSSASPTSSNSDNSNFSESKLISGTKNRKRKRTSEANNVRTFYTEEQIEHLSRMFQDNPYPEAEVMENIAREFGMADKKIKIWFQNKRARWRRQVGSSQQWIHPAHSSTPWPLPTGTVGKPDTRTLPFVSLPGANTQSTESEATMTDSKVNTRRLISSQSDGNFSKTSYGERVCDVPTWSVNKEASTPSINNERLSPSEGHGSEVSPCSTNEGLLRHSQASDMASAKYHSKATDVNSSTTRNVPNGVPIPFSNCSAISNPQVVPATTGPSHDVDFPSRYPLALYEPMTPNNDLTEHDIISLNALNAMQPCNVASKANTFTDNFEESRKQSDYVYALMEPNVQTTYRPNGTFFNDARQWQHVMTSQHDLYYGYHPENYQITLADDNRTLVSL